MAIKIVTRTLGRVDSTQDGTYRVKIRGQELKTFETKEDAENYLDKYAPRRYDVGIWANRKLKWRTFKKRKDAEDFLHRTNVDINDGTYREISRAKAKVTFSDYADRWRQKYLILEEGLKPSTLSVQQYCLDKHLISHFGPLPLRAISTEQITDFRSGLLKQALSIGHVKKLLNLLGTIFEDAIDDGYLKRSPIPPWRSKKTSASAKGPEKARALTHAQAQKLLEECRENPELELIVLLGLLAGLRRGEIFALDFSDIDWEKSILHVRRNLFWRYGKHHQLSDGKPKFIFYSPKSENSVRDVDLSPSLKNALWNRYMEMQMEGKMGLIFQSHNGSIKEKDGAFEVSIRGKEPMRFTHRKEVQAYLDLHRTPLDPNNIEGRWFKAARDRVLEKADKELDEETRKAFDGLTLHHLRHTFGSWKIAQGEDVVYVSKQMGHSKPSITYNIYAHLLEKRRPDAALLTDEKLFGKKKVVAD